MLKQYEIINHGYENHQYFQGCGVSWTDFTHCFTGCGSNAKEAYEDALDIAFQTLERDDAEALPFRPVGIRARDAVPARYPEAYWYVSIRVEIVVGVVRGPEPEYMQGRGAA